MSAAAPRILGMAPRTARIVLAASLVGNFLVAGLVGGAALKMGRGHEHGSQRFRLTEQIVDAAGPERRAAVEAALSAPDRYDWRAANAERWTTLVERIEATPFDAAALTAALDAADVRRNDGRAARNAATADALSLLTEDERKALAETIRKRLEAWERRVPAHHRD